MPGLTHPASIHQIGSVVVTPLHLLAVLAFELFSPLLFVPLLVTAVGLPVVELARGLLLHARPALPGLLLTHLLLITLPWLILLLILAVLLRV